MMRRYPSISLRLPKKYREAPVHVFDKIDGSNLRFEWDSKQGWHLWGSRTQTIDEEHPVFGDAMAIFLETLAEPIARMATDRKWGACVAFAEFWGPGSFAGHHLDEDPKRLTLFDVAPYKRGLLCPKEFLDAFADLDTPRYLGQYTWDDDFIATVLAGELDGISLEGVVGKVGSGHSLAMTKAKTQRWKDLILEKFGELAGGQLLAS